MSYHIVWHAFFPHLGKLQNMEMIFDQPDKDPRQHNDSGNQQPEPNQRQQSLDNDQTNTRNDQQNSLDKSDLPDSSNESTGKMGSGQRQDSN